MEDSANRSEAFAMMNRRTVLTERVLVRLGRVSLVAVKAVLGMRSRQGAHEFISVRLREYGCGTNEGFQRIAADNGLAWNQHIRREWAIDHHSRRNDRESANSALHGKKRRIENVKRVDLRNARLSNGPAALAFSNGFGKRLTTFRCAALRIRYAFGEFLHQDRRGHDWPGERSAPGLVHACEPSNHVVRNDGIGRHTLRATQNNR